MNFIEVDCPVCGGNTYNIVLADTLGKNPPVFGYKWTPEIRKSYRAVRCRKCSHMYSSPRLEDMYAHYTDVSDAGYVENAPLRAATARKVLQTIHKLAPSGRLLDVGCSIGDFLKEAREYYDVEGLELSEWAADIAEEAGLTIHRKKIEDIVGSGPQYDVITMWGVIEHLEYPAQEMAHIQKLLNPGGIVCFWTGDSGSFPAKVFGKNWWYIIGQHIQFFTCRSADYLMHEHGFDRVFIRTYPYVISLDYLGTSLSRYPVVGYVLNKLLKAPIVRDRTITLKLPGEMFGVYRKRK